MPNMKENLKAMEDGVRRPMYISSESEEGRRRNKVNI
jgi:hypothetical protein